MSALAGSRDGTLLNPARTQLEEGLRDVEALLSDLVASRDPTLAGPTRALVIGAGGKRLRPRLVLLAYEACGGDPDRRQLAVDAGAAYELIHAASLVHDDVIDRAPTRRGVPAVHAVSGDAAAIVAGDYLFTLGYSLAARLPPDVIPIVTDACVKLAEGQLLEMRCTNGEEDADLATSMKVVAKKTAALFEACAATGAVLAGATPEQVQALGKYGLEVGIAFQIQDDVLDVVGDPETMGKPAGTDAKEGVRTIPELVGGIDEARRVARELAERAIRRLEALPPGDARDALHGLARIVIDRAT